MHNIAVIGCGVIGLTSALEIQKKLGKTATVTIFTENVSPNTTTDIAAGLWMPYLLEDTDPQKVILWSKHTLDYILKLWKEGKAAEAGICLQPIVTFTEEENFQLPVCISISLGYSQFSKKYINQINKRFNKSYTNGFMFTSFTWEGTIFLPYLEKIFLNNGGRIIIKPIQSISELRNYDVIVNCTGLNAKYLVDDEKVFPIRGQIVRVQNPGVFQSYFSLTKNENESCYIIPNTESIVLGGTKQKDCNKNITDVDAKKITKNCQRMLPELTHMNILKHQVGLRPARNQVRLECEQMKVDGKHLKIVHNYGHGGSGITVCIGCAMEAAELVEQSLKNNSEQFMTSKL